MSNESWRTELQTWANQYTRKLAQKAGVVGVVIGGSIARGQEWLHSDLEVGILVEESDGSLPYFNVDNGRGVEIIQLSLPQTEAQIKQIAAGDVTPVTQWPIQLWQCRIVHDPSRILAQFKSQFDALLFREDVIGKRLADLQFAIQGKLAEAKLRLAQGNPTAALIDVRYAMNDLILASYWAFRELPRSQNRTDSRLYALCQKYSIMPLYEIYHDVFALSNTAGVIKSRWPKVKDKVLEITRFWGDSARDFFIHAVDGEFQWGEDGGILTVYRLYVPIVGGAEALQHRVNDADWRDQHKDLVEFLGLNNVETESVSAFITRIEAWLERLQNEMPTPSQAKTL